MSVGQKAFKGASWLALFKFISQLCSWIITILVARILTPDDYGLMTKATIITGYAMIFNELGLGAAIIQRPKLKQKELSSIFWFALGIGIILGIICFLVAYPTAWIFHDRRVIPITQAVSILFVLGALQIVPLNLLKKELEFKKIGLIEMTGIIVSSLCMYAIARMGGGVWTLLGGHIIRNSTKVALTYLYSGWFPQVFYKHGIVKSYLKFGITVALGESLFYVYDKSDRFLAGRVWSSSVLGYYTFALQLAKIPVEKIVVLINQVSFPAFAKLQNRPEEFKKFYLDTVEITTAIVLPLFVGGYLAGDELVRVLLNPKWYPMTFIFKMLCLAQIITAVNAINNFVHIAQGRPKWSLAFNAMMAFLLPPSFYFAAKYGLNAIVIPWFSTYLALCILWIGMTIRKCCIGLTDYLKAILMPIQGTILLVGAIHILMILLKRVHISSDLQILTCQILLGVSVYSSFVLIFGRNLLLKLKNMRSQT